MLLNSYLLLFLFFTHRADMLLRLPRSDHRDPVSRRYIYMPHTVPELHFVNTDTVVNIRSFYNLGFRRLMFSTSTQRYVPIPFGPSTPFAFQEEVNILHCLHRSGTVSLLRVLLAVRLPGCSNASGYVSSGFSVQPTSV